MITCAMIVWPSKSATKQDIKLSPTLTNTKNKNGQPHIRTLQTGQDSARRNCYTKRQFNWNLMIPVSAEFIYTTGRRANPSLGYTHNEAGLVKHYVYTQRWLSTSIYSSITIRTTYKTIVIWLVSIIFINTTSIYAMCNILIRWVRHDESFLSGKVWGTN